MKKSWKSAANFDDEMPRFTPFKTQADMLNKLHTNTNGNQVDVAATPTPSTTLQPAEPLGGKISSKIKMPTKYIADIYSLFKKENKNSAENDFGSFDHAAEADTPAPEKAESSSPAPEKTESRDEFTTEHFDIETIINELSDDEADDSSDNKIRRSDDGIEIESIDDEQANNTQYKVGSLMNLTIDSDDSTVNVNLDQTTLKEIITGSSSENYSNNPMSDPKLKIFSISLQLSGRGRKNSMLERVIPLFILPFLIQSAVVPFMVSMIKLFLIKSLFAGKVAILLLTLGALKNHQNGIYMKSMHQPQFYPPAYPERRIETNFEGYKVEGKTAAYVN